MFFSGGEQALRPPWLREPNAAFCKQILACKKEGETGKPVMSVQTSLPVRKGSLTLKGNSLGAFGCCFSASSLLKLWGWFNLCWDVWCRSRSGCVP